MTTGSSCSTGTSGTTGDVATGGVAAVGVLSRRRLRTKYCMGGPISLSSLYNQSNAFFVATRPLRVRGDEASQRRGDGGHCSFFIRRLQKRYRFRRAPEGAPAAQSERRSVEDH